MNAINNLATRLQLSLLVATALIAFLIIGLIGIVKLSEVNKGLETVYNDRVIPLNQLKKIADAYAVNIVDTTHKTRNGNISFNDCVKNINDAKKTVDNNWKAYMATELTPEEATLAKETSAVMSKGDKITAKILDSCEIKDTALLSEISIKELYPLIDPIGEKVSALMELQLRVAKSEKEKAVEVYESARMIIVSTIIVAFTLLIILSTLIIKDITNKIEKIRLALILFFRFLGRETAKVEIIDLDSNDEFGQMAKVINDNIREIEMQFNQDNHLVEEAKRTIVRVQHGWYSENIQATTTNHSLEEFKNGVNDMIKGTRAHFVSINEILEQYTNYNYTKELKLDNIEKGGALDTLVTDINKLRDAVTQMLKSSLQNGLELENEAGNLKQAVEALSTASNQQAASLEETAAAMEEMTSNVQNNAQKANDMAVMAAQTDASAKEGAELAGRTANAMNEIQHATSSINDAVAIIENIAFQTNILSLNAAVEAATAGDAGKGFAVVAQEVRNLANRSADAAKEIKTLAAQASQKSNEGTAIATELTRGFEVIADKIAQTTILVQDVSNASREQMQGIGQINTAVTQLDQMTQENAKIAAQADTIADATIEKAQAMVDDASAKNFIGKDQMQVAVISKAAPIRSKPRPMAKKSISPSVKKSTLMPTKPQSNDDGDIWESF
jgi:methyl-accepting chemotaxis protein